MYGKLSREQILKKGGIGALKLIIKEQIKKEIKKQTLKEALCRCVYDANPTPPNSGITQISGCGTCSDECCQEAGYIGLANIAHDDLGGRRKHDYEGDPRPKKPKSNIKLDPVHEGTKGCKKRKPI